MQLNPPPVRTITEILAPNLSAGDHVIAIGLYSRMHGIGKIAAIRDKLIAVKFESGHTNEFTELQLRKVNS
jgi:hypothetical protein